MQATLEELRKLKHLNVAALGGRTINLMPLWEDNRWNLWVQNADGTFINLKPLDAASSTYWAKEAATPEDFYIAFLDLMWQRASWPDVYKFISAIADDFRMLAASAGKIELFHKHRNELSTTLASTFVKSELEYMTVVARSVFDLTQEVMAACWNNHMQLIDPTSEAIRKKRPLPPTFAKVLFREGKLREQVELEAFYALPPLVAEKYIKHAAFFSSLREWRDRIIHGTSRMDGIYVLEKGFGVNPQSSVFNDYPWKPEHHFNENVVSLLPWIARLIFQTIEACTDIIVSFAHVVQLPEEIAPGYRVFVRDPTNKAFGVLLEAAFGERVWWVDEEKSELPSSS